MSYPDVFAAMVDLVRSDAACRTNLPGGVHADKASPESLAKGATAVLTEVGGSASFAARTGGIGTGTRIDDSVVQISCYAGTRTLAVAAGAAVAAAVVGQEPTLDVGTVVLIRQASRNAELDPDLGPGGGPIWRELREFRVVVALPD